MSSNSNFNFGTTITIITSSGSRIQLLRDRSEKKSARKYCKTYGIEERVRGLCAKCGFDRRPLAKKHETSNHYGCTRSCCPLIHQWNVCDYCLRESLNPMTPAKRKADAERFRRVFSRLPEDMQRLVEEYVPQIFGMVRLCGRFISGCVVPSARRYLVLPKPFWTGINDLLSSRVVYVETIKRESICDALQKQYGEFYVVYFDCLITDNYYREEDFRKIRDQVSKLDKINKYMIRARLNERLV